MLVFHRHLPDSHWHELNMPSFAQMVNLMLAVQDIKKTTLWSQFNVINGKKSVIIVKPAYWILIIKK